VVIAGERRVLQSVEKISTVRACRAIGEPTSQIGSILFETGSAAVYKCGGQRPPWRQQWR
jgi:hypothetical protein